MGERITWLLPAIVVGLLGTFTPADASEHCGRSPIPFASCPAVPRNYNTVILAVHGWNGSCRGTFGEGEQSVFQVLGSGKHFFDFDCLEYDSRNTSVRDNARKLYNRMLTLHSEGYRHAMLITHSTGGVIALQMLTDVILDANGASREDFGGEVLFAPNGLKIAAVQAWATPINGLRPTIRFAGRVISLLGYSPETFPDLAADSTFLVNLKKRLAILADLSQLSRDARSRVQKVIVNFYHGQGTDGVVYEIHRRQARSEGWLWPDGRGELIDTDTGHSHNVAESGQVGEPRFTGRTLQLEALLSLPFELRYDEVFPSDLPVLPPSLTQRQIQVIDALTFYVRRNFPAAVAPTIDFLHKIITQRWTGARSREVDGYVVDELLKLLRETPADDDMVRFLAGFGKRVLMHYDPRGGENVGRFGHNRDDIAQGMIKLVRATLDTVREYLVKKEEKERARILVTQGYRRLRDFERDMHTVLGLFLDHSSNMVWREAVGNIRDVVTSGSADALRGSTLLKSLHRFTMQKHHALEQEQKTQILRTVELAVRRSPSSRAEILGEWSREVSYRGQRRPLWMTLNDDDVIGRIVGEIPKQGRLRSAELQFLVDVASGGGATGDGSVARMAERRFLDGIATGQVERELQSRYRETLMSSSDPASRRIGERLLEAAKRLGDRERPADPSVDIKARVPEEIPGRRFGPVEVPRAAAPPKFPR